MAGIHTGIFTETQLHEIETAKLAHKLRLKQDKKQAGKACRGSIYIENTYTTIQTCKDQEIAKDNHYLVYI
jgi:hypothetical protein